MLRTMTTSEIHRATGTPAHHAHAPAGAEH